jgi:hypothetical protein
MNFPRPSVTPEAVRNSVSMFSLITGARAGISFRNSISVAALQRGRGPLCTPAAFETINAEDRTAHITLVANGMLTSDINQAVSKARAAED